MASDEPTKVRAGEEIDAQKLMDYLKDQGIETSPDIEIRQFQGGYSNLTYLVRIGGTSYILRRPPFGKKAKSAHDMGREYNILKALRPYYPYCPRPLVYTEDPSVMGCPFYMMERIDGIILRKDFPKGFAMSADRFNALCKRLVEVHYELHALDYKAIGLENFGKPDGYVERQVTGWCNRYRDARTPDAPDFEIVMSWLTEHMPADADKPALIHNDFKFDNVVLDRNDPRKIIGVLDWEMATIGDPRMDLGNSMAYWVEAADPEEDQLRRMLPTGYPGALSRREIVDYYRKLSGRDMSGFDYYYCFGLFRLAVIAQQIYYRFYHGQTKNEVFGLLISAVQILERDAIRVIQAAK
ncbi:MAG: phosphotransferase family protein [Thermodesulfobacteriota bacterium]